MKLILFGATGMVGAGLLREALADHDVDSVLSIGRKPSAVERAKLRELILPDLFDFSAVEPQLSGWDACIWTVGINSVGSRRSGVRARHRRADAALGKEAPRIERVRSPPHGEN